ncbi:hypothetical protein ACFPN2_33410 [Steroidobacter flavus]|uniref:DUF4760 domain-containing protein n=1 Tax=Steroidobacter flavus TaxID=1842136 RepID=A0ABV8T2P8_9GAMM
MDSAAYVPAFLGLLGVAVGGLTSFASSWFTQRWQFREKRIEAVRSRRELLFSSFIEEATRVYADALTHEKDDFTDLVRLYSLYSQIRLVATEESVHTARVALDALVEAYLSPNRTLHEIYAEARAGKLTFLEDFSKTCRQELDRLSA